MPNVILLNFSVVTMIIRYFQNKVNIISEIFRTINQEKGEKR